MNLRELRVRVIPGAGLVVNDGAILVLAFPESDAQERVVDEILGLVEAAAGEDPASLGRRLVRRIVVALAAAEPDDVPPFGLLALTDRGLAVLLHGDVDVEVGADGEHLSGRNVSTWLDRIVDGDLDGLTMHRSDGAAVADPRSDLRAGTVPAAGVVLQRRWEPGAALPAEPSSTAAEEAEGEPAAEPATDESAAAGPPPVPPPPLVEEPDAESVAFVSVSLSEPLPAEELQPLPLAGPSAEPDDALDAGGPPPAPVQSDHATTLDRRRGQVQGTVCSRQHFNHPSALVCSSCGIPMEDHALVRGRRPPLGILVLDDGSAFVLDDDYVIGREPGGHADVQSGEARPLVVTDPAATTSRSHARIHLDGWEVQLIDLGSANGTFVAPAGATEWTRLAAHAPAPIGPGSRVHICGRSFVVEAPGTT